MRSEVIYLNKEREVTLTTYILDSSRELSNAEQRPAMLILPGGGYHMCSDREAEPIAMAYAAEGYNAFVLRYSVGANSKWPNPLVDAETALSIIREHSKDWGVDSSKIAVIGFSAGGHLAAALATLGKVKPNAAILAYPCILEEIGNIFPSPVPGLDDKVNSTTPPTFLFTTRDDGLVPSRNTLCFIEALDQASIPYEAHIFYTGQHGLSLGKGHTSSGFVGNVNLNVAKWFDMSIEWLKQVLGGFKVDQEFMNMDMDENTEFYGIDFSLRTLMQKEECKSILVSYLPFFANEEVIKPALGISLRTMSQHAKDTISPDMLKEIENKLNRIKK